MKIPSFLRKRENKPHTSHNVGVTGEKLACEYLIKEGYKITSQNLRYKRLETDIICENEEFIVFCEVKTRTRAEEAHRPSKAVNGEKKLRMVNAAKTYMSTHSTGKIPRIDVIEIILDEDMNMYSLNHIRSAVTGKDRKYYKRIKK